MHALAIRRFDGEMEVRAGRLAAATGLAMLEARTRARGPGPRVVCTFGDAADAALAAAALDAEGFAPLLVRDEEIEQDAQRVIARSVRIDEGALAVTSRDGRTVVAPLASVELLLRGTALRSSLQTSVTKARKLSLGKAVLTGGILLTRQVEKKETRETHEQEAFLQIYAGGLPTLVLREGAIQHEAARAGRPLEPSRAANFARLVADLRAAAPGAVWDDRLLTRAGQLQLLGGALDPEMFLDLALTVLARALRSPPAGTPYRGS